MTTLFEREIRTFHGDDVEIIDVDVDIRPRAARAAPPQPTRANLTAAPAKLATLLLAVVIGGLGTFVIGVIVWAMFGPIAGAIAGAFMGLACLSAFAGNAFSGD